MPGRGQDCVGEEVAIFRIVMLKGPRRPRKLVGVGLFFVSEILYRGIGDRWDLMGKVVYFIFKSV